MNLRCKLCKGIITAVGSSDDYLDQCTECGTIEGPTFESQEIDLERAHTLRQSAFGGYLRSLDFNQAKGYLFTCLKNGGTDNLAWEIFEALGLETVDQTSLDYMTDFLLTKGSKS